MRGGKNDQYQRNRTGNGVGRHDVWAVFGRVPLVFGQRRFPPDEVIAFYRAAGQAAEVYKVERQRRASS